MPNEEGPPRPVALSREPIELVQLLKLAELTASGGEGKYAVATGLVRVNGEVESRMRRKLYAGDLVEYGGARVRVVGAGKEPGA